MLVAGLDPGADVIVELTNRTVDAAAEFLVGGSAKHRSTRFSQEGLVGVECGTNRDAQRARAESPAFCGRRLY
jgi:hypothetical protein